MPDSFTIRPAVRVNTPAFVALAGPSGSGKTRSALELATGLAGDGKILLADTEGNRGLHYADLYAFDHVEFSPPFTPERCAELVDLAERNGYAVLIVDSGSDEYEGEGGLQEIRDTTNDEFWARTKARHKHALVNRIRRARLHTIWCLRCEERVKISKVNGRTVVETLGWQPICEKRFLYEMQSSFRFDPEHPGVPVPIKLYDIHSRFFPKDQPIGREAGRRLAEWAAGGASVSAKPADLLLTAEQHADLGVTQFRQWWANLSANERDILRPNIPELQRAVEKADTAIPATAAPQPSLQKGDPTQVGLPLSGDAGQSTRPSRAASKPPLIIVSRVSDPDGTADDLIAGLKSSKTLPESNAFIKANGPTIQALPDDAHGHWHEAMTEWLREMEAQ